MGLRFCEPDDLLLYEHDLDSVFPRVDKNGNPRHDWTRYIELAMTQIHRDLRSRRTYREPIELGRIGLRSRANLKEPCVWWTLVFIFNNLNTTDWQPGGVYETKQRQYERWARDALDAEAVALDYDESGDGTIDEAETQRPMPALFLRG